MSLASDLDDLFEDGKETIINEPIKFKAKLGVGERAYGLLRAREHLTTITEAMGAAGAATAAASSTVVAGAFFAPTGFLAALGLGAAAATPIGWVLAAGAVSGTAYFGVSRFLERSKDSHLIVVPKFINTPLDVIALALIEMMLPVSFKVAYSDGVICEQERRALHDYYVDQWGYSPKFLDRMLADYEEHLDHVSFAALANSLERYCKENPDCDPEIILNGFLTHISEVTEANGDISEQELKQLNYLIHLMTQAAETSPFMSVLETAKSGVSKGVEKTTEVASAGLDSAGNILKTGIEKSSPYAEKAAATAAKGFSTATDLAGKITEKVQLGPSKLKDLLKPKPGG